MENSAKISLISSCRLSIVPNFVTSRRRCFLRPILCGCSILSIWANRRSIRPRCSRFKCSMSGLIFLTSTLGGRMNLGLGVLLSRKLAAVAMTGLEGLGAACCCFVGVSPSSARFSRLGFCRYARLAFLTAAFRLLVNCPAFLEVFGLAALVMAVVDTEVFAIFLGCAGSTFFRPFVACEDLMFGLARDFDVLRDFACVVCDPALQALQTSFILASTCFLASSRGIPLLRSTS